MAVVLVLGLLALTLTLSYAMLRMEYQVQQSQTNISGQDRARLAAVTGVSIALRQMHDGTWAGVGTSLQGAIDSGANYSVVFTTGDAALTSSHSEYLEYPYRVTISAMGTAADLSQSGIQTSYQVTAVAQLARRQINAGTLPSRWGQLNTHTVYQWNTSSTPRDVVIEIPCQVQGAVCLEGALKLCQAYPKYSNSRERYLKDLKLMSQAGIENRPFTGTVALDKSRQSGSAVNELSSWLGVNVSEITANASTPLSYPAGTTTYQLYPGGQVYPIPRLQDVLGAPAKNQVLSTDPVNNPLGIYRSDGSWTFLQGNQFTGTLLCDSPTAVITIGGTSVKLNGVNLLGIEGSSAAYQLPLAIVQNDIAVAHQSNSTVNGLVMAWNQFVVNPGSKTTTLTMTGRIFSDGFQILGRSEWNALTQATWQTSLTDFEAQYDPLLFSLGLSEEFYPRWMERSPYYLAAPPRLKIVPPTNVSYHWPSFSQPIYVKADGDPGLRWNLVSWGEKTP
ncbi:MAG TPA: hypothetical protein VMP01_19715 [Pirellulaceae bacterium]|nr:hypothetical protein [Pirellulaceae bacterium]